MIFTKLFGRRKIHKLYAISSTDHEYISDISLDCLCQAGLTPWSVIIFYHITTSKTLFFFFCKMHVSLCCAPPTALNMVQVSLKPCDQTHVTGLSSHNLVYSSNYMMV